MERINNNVQPEHVVDNTDSGVDLLDDKPEFVKKIESFDVHDLKPENIEFMNSIIQNTFKDHFPVDPELVDQIPSRMNLVSAEEYTRLSEDSGVDANLGYYNKRKDQIFINAEKHQTPGALFSTMFHESLHYVGIQSGAGMTGDFCYPFPGEGAEVDEMIYYLDKGMLTVVEGTTQLITQAYVLDFMGFTEQEQMITYEPEVQIMGTILGALPVEECLEAYFNTPMELLRVRIEDAFADDYDPDNPTGLFADYVANIGEATEKIETALESWRENDDPEPVEAVLGDVRHAVGAYITREVENGTRVLSDEDKEKLRDYLES